jgi:hypothetical protein
MASAGGTGSMRQWSVVILYQVVTNNTTAELSYIVLIKYSGFRGSQEIVMNRVHVRKKLILIHFLKGQIVWWLDADLFFFFFPLVWVVS